MTDLQLYILVAIPLVGILTNTALFIHLSSRFDTLTSGLRTDIKNVRDELKADIKAVRDELRADIRAVNAALNAVEADVAILKERAKL